MIFTNDPNVALNDLLNANRYSSVFVLVDENTQKHCIPLIKRSLKDRVSHTFTVSAGENTKNIDTCIHIWQDLNRLGADRHALLINVGGGMINDLGGFVASTYKRGMDFINVPTSMLAMIDASIGGKNGINLGGMKNQIGTIRQPREVIINPGFLASLDRRNYLSGYAEALKHGLIGDPGAYQKTLKFISPKIDDALFLEFLQDNIAIKERIVEIDPEEKGERKQLNLGHTIGHALETLSHHKGKPLLHGEAVAWGIVAELSLSEKLHGFPGAVLKAVSQLVCMHYVKPDISEADYVQLIDYMKQDKKNYGKNIHFALLQKPGECLLDETTDKSNIVESLEYVRSLCQS